jgi:hypothetical protein
MGCRSSASAPKLFWPCVSIHRSLTALSNSSVILSAFYAVFLEIRRCLPFWSRKQAVQNCESGCLQTLVT